MDKNKPRIAKEAGSKRQDYRCSNPKEIQGEIITIFIGFEGEIMRNLKLQN